MGLKTDKVVLVSMRAVMIAFLIVSFILPKESKAKIEKTNKPLCVPQSVSIWICLKQEEGAFQISQAIHEMEPHKELQPIDKAFTLILNSTFSSELIVCNNGKCLIKMESA